MTDNKKCLICQERIASKKNSHIIPSFLIAPIFSYDGSNKRGSEVMVTITPSEEKVFIGELPDTKIEKLFDQENLTEERIESELKINTASKDYIFCPKCESDLSKYLETPYSNELRDNKNSDIIPFFFWMSVIWRVSISGQFGAKLDTSTENRLGTSIKAYLNAADNAMEGIEHIISESSFFYRILRFDGYLTNSPGNIVADYDTENKILSVVIGEIVVSASFAGKEIPESYSFFGAEKYLKNAPINDGTNKEIISHLDSSLFCEIMKEMVSTLAKQKINTEYEIIDSCWQMVGLSGHMPEDIFKAYMEILLDENTKLGDRMTNERRVDVFNKALQSFGFIPKDDKND